MTISAHGFEIPETISHTVSLSHEGPGEFSAVYWDALQESFVTVKHVDPRETSVDASTYEKMLFSLKQRKCAFADSRVHPLGLSASAVGRLRSVLTAAQYEVAEHFATKRTRDSQSPFVKGCMEQLKAWANKTTAYPMPLSDTQWKILNSIYYTREL
jgi:hypothetical protein